MASLLANQGGAEASQRLPSRSSLSPPLAHLHRRAISAAAAAAAADVPASASPSSSGASTISDSALACVSSPTSSSCTTGHSPSSHLPTGQAPSIQSLLSPSEAHASHIPYVCPPPSSGQTRTGSTAARVSISLTPSSHSTTTLSSNTSTSASVSRPVSRRSQSLLSPSFLPRSPLPEPTSIHSSSLASNLAPSHPIDARPQQSQAQRSSKRKKFVSVFTPPKENDPSLRRSQTDPAVVVVAKDLTSDESRPQTSSSAVSGASTVTPSTATDNPASYCDPKPFAKKPTQPVRRATEPQPPTEDIDSFEFRLRSNLSTELAQIYETRIKPSPTDEMGLGRSFTKRLGRPLSLEPSAQQHSRPQISMPMGLISTTNQWVHDVPNIADLHVKDVQQRQMSDLHAKEIEQRQVSSSSNSSANYSDSETSPTSEPPSMTDTSSVESFSPVELPVEVEPNHLTRYFTPFEESPSKSEAATVEVTDFTPISPAPLASEPEKPLLAAPKLPTRSLSHSKREHERLARARSIRSSTASTEHLSQKHHSSMVAPASLTTDDITSASLSPPAKSSSRPPSITLEEPKPLSPFSRELQQLDEVAEEFKPGAHQSWVAEDREDRRVMQELGLKSYRVSEYIKEIQSFREGLWALLEEEEEEEEARQAAWI